MSWQRIFYLLLIALLEAIPATVVLLLLGASNPIILVFLVVVVSGVLQKLLDRFIDESHQRFASIAVGVIAGAWLAKTQVGGGIGLLSGWGQGFNQLFNSDSSLGYVAFLTGLYTSYRSSFVLGHDSDSLRSFFQRNMVVLMLIIALFSLLAFVDVDNLPILTVLMMVFFAGNLFAIALANAAEHDVQLKRIGWRSWMPIAVAIGLILLLSLVVSTLFASDLINVVIAIGQAILTILLLLLSPFIYLIAWIIEWLASFVSPAEAQNITEGMFGTIELVESETAAPLVLPDWVKRSLQIVGALIPVLIIALLYFLGKRRKKEQAQVDEVRESLWDWSDLQDDLRNLFKRRASERQDLQERLKQLQADDPVTRVRRAYVQWLLLNLQRKQGRASTQTPHEYQVQNLVQSPRMVQPISTLTQTYERARYGSSVSPNEAEQAEQALDQIKNS